MSPDLVYSVFYIVVLSLLLKTPYFKFLHRGKGMESDQLMEAWVKYHKVRQK